MTRTLRAVVRNGRIELPATDLAEGQEVEVTLRDPAGEAPAPAWGEGIRATAGCLAYLPDSVFDELDQIVAARRHGTIREVEE